jgi:hypothetical protein
LQVVCGVGAFVSENVARQCSDQGTQRTAHIQKSTAQQRLCCRPTPASNTHTHTPRARAATRFPQARQTKPTSTSQPREPTDRCFPATVSRPTHRHRSNTPLACSARSERPPLQSGVHTHRSTNRHQTPHTYTHDSQHSYPETSDSITSLHREISPATSIASAFHLSKP